MGEEEGAIFRKYLWGKKGIADFIKSLHYDKYGYDLNIILFKFYVNPDPYTLSDLKEVEPYRKSEQSISTNIIVNNSNFFLKSENERREFIKNSIMEKLNSIEEIVTKKKLDTNMNLLKSDLKILFDNYHSWLRSISLSCFSIP